MAAQVRATKSVVSNASLWDTQRLLPGHVITPKMQKQAQARLRYAAMPWPLALEKVPAERGMCQKLHFPLIQAQQA